MAEAEDSIMDTSDREGEGSTVSDHPYPSSSGGQAPSEDEAEAEGEGADPEPEQGAGSPKSASSELDNEEFAERMEMAIGLYRVTEGSNLPHGHGKDLSKNGWLAEAEIKAIKKGPTLFPKGAENEGYPVAHPIFQKLTDHHLETTEWRFHAPPSSHPYLTPSVDTLPNPAIGHNLGIRDSGIRVLPIGWSSRAGEKKQDPMSSIPQSVNLGTRRERTSEGRRALSKDFGRLSVVPGALDGTDVEIRQ